MSRAEWTRREADHARRVDELVGDAPERRRRGEKHPVKDFMFDYYTHRLGRLRQWHPGYGVVLEDAGPEWLQRRGYVEAAVGVRVGEAELERLLPVVGFVAELLERTAQRPAQFGCFGLHEWAMVHGMSADEVRHAGWPLRRSPEEVKELIAEIGLGCTHFDAFRFYTDSARPLNPNQLTRESRLEMEQGGCLHANMDLYKWSYKLSPLVPSELIADAFDLAMRIRTLDMQSAPYDLRGLGYEPVPVENAQGRAEFVRLQREFAREAAAIRERLLGSCAELLAGEPLPGELLAGEKPQDSPRP